MGAVAAHDVAGLDVLCVAVGMGDGGAHVVGALVEVGQLDAALDRGAGAGEVVVEDRLGGGLGQEEQERVGGVVEADVEQGHLGRALAGV